MKTKACLTAFLILTALWASAQDSKYKLLTRGKPCPFDTAIAVQIKTYRLESLKMELQDSAIHRQQLQIQTLSSAVKKAQQISAHSDSIAQIRLNLLSSKTTLAAALQAENLTLKNNLVAAKKWYRRPEPWFVFGALAGLLITK